MYFGVVLVKRKVARNAEEVKEVDLQVAPCTGEFALITGHLQADVGVRPGGDVELACTVVHYHVFVRTDSGDTTVDLHVQVVGAERHALYAHQGHRARAGLQAGEFARRTGWCALCRTGCRGSRFFCHERQTKADVLQGQAQRVFCTAIQTRKGVYAAAAYGEQVYINGAGLCGVAAIIEHHGVTALLYGKAAAHLEEAKEVDVQVAADGKHFTTSAIHAQGKVAVRSGFNRQRGLVLCVVHHRVVDLARLVDCDAQGVGRDRHAVHADKGCAGCAGLQAGPAACGVCGGADKSQTEFHSAELQAQCVVRAAFEAGKGAYIGGANGQQVGGSAVFAVRERDSIFECALGDCKVAVQLHKTEQVYREVTAGLQQGSTFTVHVQGEFAGRAGLDDHLKACKVYDAGVARIRLVDLYVQGVGRNGQAVYAHEGRTARASLDGCPAAWLLRSGCCLTCIRCIKLLAHQGHCQVDAFELQSQCINGATVQARKGIGVRDTDAQDIDFDRFCGASQLHVFGGLAYCKACINLQEAKGVECEVAAGFEQGAFAGVHGERQGAAVGSVGDFQWRAQVVDEAAVTGSLVDVDLQVGGL